MIIKAPEMRLLSFFGVEGEKPLDLGPDLLGSKGFGLRLLSEWGYSTPPGFTIRTTECRPALENLQMHLAKMWPRVLGALKQVKKQAGGHMPLLSIRSGAECSMPGILKSYQNIGLTRLGVPMLTGRIGMYGALDCYRRLLEQMGELVGIPETAFEAERLNECETDEAKSVADLTTAGMDALTCAYEKVYELHEREIPNPGTQVAWAMAGVYGSWNTPKAKEYRRKNHILDEPGTAVTVQEMVYGNAAGECSGTGVVFTRDPITGVRAPVGEFKEGGQGPDVVDGAGKPEPLYRMPKKGKAWKDLYEKLKADAGALENSHDGEPLDLEFTVEAGRLYWLQMRALKYTPTAAFQLAVDLESAGEISRQQAIWRCVDLYSKVGVPRVITKKQPVATGIGACSGVAVGRAAFTGDHVAEYENPILVRKETSTNDVSLMGKAAGLLTAAGGMTSHAAINARILYLPCVVGCEALKYPLVQLGTMPLKPGDKLTIDGSDGSVWRSHIPVTAPDKHSNAAVRQVLAWAFELTGKILESPELMWTRQRVPVAEWLGPQGDGEQGIRALKALGQMEPHEREGIVLDLRLPETYRPGEDCELWGLFGGLGEVEAKALKVLVQMLVQRGLVGTGVCLPGGVAALDLEKAGYRLVREVRTVADILTTSGLVVVPRAVMDDVIGGEEAWGVLVNLMAKAGQKIEALPEAQTAEEAMQEAVDVGA